MFARNTTYSIKPNMFTAVFFANFGFTSAIFAGNGVTRHKRVPVTVYQEIMKGTT